MNVIVLFVLLCSDFQAFPWIYLVKSCITEKKVPTLKTAYISCVCVFACREHNVCTLVSHPPNGKTKSLSISYSKWEKSICFHSDYSSSFKFKAYTRRALHPFLWYALAFRTGEHFKMLSIYYRSHSNAFNIFEIPFYWANVPVFCFRCVCLLFVCGRTHTLQYQPTQFFGTDVSKV